MCYSHLYESTCDVRSIYFNYFFNSETKWKHTIIVWKARGSRKLKHAVCLLASSWHDRPRTEMFEPRAWSALSGNWCCEWSWSALRARCSRLDVSVSVSAAVQWKALHALIALVAPASASRASSDPLTQLSSLTPVSLRSFRAPVHGFVPDSPSLTWTPGRKAARLRSETDMRSIADGVCSSVSVTMPWSHRWQHNTNQWESYAPSWGMTCSSWRCALLW